MAIKTHQLFTIGLMCGIGVYTGVKFFEPIVIEQLKKDGNLRSDIPIPKYDADGNPVIIDNTGAETTWEDIRKKDLAKLADDVKELNTVNQQENQIKKDGK